MVLLLKQQGLEEMNSKQEVMLLMILAPEPFKEALKEGLVTKVSPPTVISPRIKALTTGNIPGFVDIVRNFDTAQLTEDNLIRQWREQE